jgi:hypothetical protein
MTIHKINDTWIMKTNSIFQQNIWFHWTFIYRDEDKNILFCANSTKHSPWFLSVKEILLQLSVAKLLALSLQEIVEFFVTFEIVPHTWCFVGCEQSRLQQSYWYGFWVLINVIKTLPWIISQVLKGNILIIISVCTCILWQQNCVGYWGLAADVMKLDIF